MIFSKKGLLLSFVFHGVFNNEEQIEFGHVYPHWPITVAKTKTSRRDSFKVWFSIYLPG
jgi:hypothetical protein